MSASIHGVVGFPAGRQKGIVAGYQGAEKGK
jgi:hypothetical protein